MIAEDLTVYLADFSVPAVYGAQTAGVLFDINDADTMLSGRMISAGYVIYYRATDLVGLKHNDILQVSGTSYTVNTVMRVEDGAFTRATLQVS